MQPKNKSIITKKQHKVLVSYLQSEQCKIDLINAQTNPEQLKIQQYIKNMGKVPYSVYLTPSII